MFARLSFAAVCLSAAGLASAAPSPTGGTFNVTANVAASCRVSATTDIAFGTYDPADAHSATPLDANGSVSVRCTKGTTATVALQQGNNPASGSDCAAPLRQMANGTERLRYDIYSDAARTTVWGCQTIAPANSQSFTAAASNAPTVLTTYGRIPANQDVSAGNFTDAVTVQVTF